MRALIIPGIENMEANLMSIGGTLSYESRLHADIVDEIRLFSKVEVYLFATK